MDLQDYVTFATENPVCQLATIDGDQAKVRTVLMWYADESGFYFITLSPEDMSKQLQENPKVELCFCNNAADLMDARQLRVTGEIEFLEDEETLAKAYEARAFLHDIAGQPTKPFVQPFRISAGEAHFWTMGDVLREPELERMTF
jgi:pyridoxamine 5'-phosphate oxidase